MMAVLNVGKVLFLLMNSLLIGCNSDNKSVPETKIDNVKLEMTFMAYACGDCVDLYRIDKVITVVNNEKEFFLNKEIEVEILDKENLSFLEKTNCPWNCYKFTCEGEIYRKKNGMLFLKSKKTTLTKIQKCCTIE